MKMPTRALIRVRTSCESAPDHSPFFMRNQVRSETSPSSPQTSTLVSRQISARRTTPSTADGVSRSRVRGSPRFGTAGSGAWAESRPEVGVAHPDLSR